jgi:hypothetical protein
VLPLFKLCLNRLWIWRSNSRIYKKWSSITKKSQVLALVALFSRFLGKL